MNFHRNLELYFADGMKIAGDSLKYTNKNFYKVKWWRHKKSWERGDLWINEEKNLLHNRRILHIYYLHIGINGENLKIYRQTRTFQKAI